MSNTGQSTPAAPPRLDTAQTLLFVPAARPDRFDKARASGAHAIIIDLEDAVAPEGKASARDAVGAWLTAGDWRDTADRTAVVVRINAADTDWFHPDVEALADAAARLSADSDGRTGHYASCPFGIMIPKCESEEPVHEIRQQFTQHGVAAPYTIGLLETPRGIVAAESLARARSVHRFAFGNYDLGLELDALVGAEETELLFARSRVVMAARAFGMPGPIDGPCADFSTEGATEASAARGRALGFAGKLAIHPRQLAAIDAEFGDSDEDVAWARRVVAAAEDAGGAAVNVDGAMVDAPVLKRAQRIVARSGR